MNSYGEILGEIVEQIRTWRRNWIPISQIVHDLMQYGLDSHKITTYLRVAFCSDSPLINIFYLRNEDGLDSRAVDELLTKVIDDARPEWESALPYPDLLRRRDRHAFRTVARSRKAIIVIEAPNPWARQYAGQPGHRASDIFLLRSFRQHPPFRGLLAADPDDGNLKSYLKWMREGATYDQFVTDLHRGGFQVGGEEEGFIIRDPQGNALFPCYSLHGMYREASGMNLWNGQEGEKIRAELNFRLGNELIFHGPFDNWDKRLHFPERCPYRNPQTPVLFFLPDGNVEVRTDTGTMESYYRYLGIDWDSLYPVPEQEGEL